LPPVAELLLMFAARSVHLPNIEPNLRAAGGWCAIASPMRRTPTKERGRRVNQDDIRYLETIVQGARRPDLTLLLDVPVDVGLERSRKRDAGKTLDRFERERAEFFERVRGGYLLRARAEPERMAVIDATASMPTTSRRASRKC
jgi:dTMP kinase